MNSAKLTLPRRTTSATIKFTTVSLTSPGCAGTLVARSSARPGGSWAGRVQELVNRLVEHPWLVHEGHVPAVREDDQLRAWNPGIHVAGQRRVALVVVAHRDQRRHFNRTQSIGVLHGGEVAVDHEFTVPNPHLAVQVPRHV